MEVVIMKNIGKRVISIILFLVLNISSAFAFTYPTPDWGALYEEKSRMVNSYDLELYTEGSGIHTPYYGAKFEPQNGIYIGSIPENSQPLLPVSSYLTYINDMYQTDLYHPANIMIEGDSVVSLIGWTINSMDGVNYNIIRETLDRLNEYNKPMFIRFANEMNCSQLGDDPYKYVEIFKNVANMIHEYPNFAVVWSPIDIGALDRPFEYFYPGDEYVDWVGVSCYSIKYFMGNKNAEEKSKVYFMTDNYSWATNRLKPIVEFMEKNNIQKPLMISEGGVATNNSYGDIMEDWATPRLRNMLYNVVMKYPQVKMINYFNTHRANEIEKFDITPYQYAVNIFNEAAASGAYLRQKDSVAEFMYTLADKGETLKANNGIIRLHTLAYIPNQPNISVNYTLDGNWYHSANNIPYTCNLDISGLFDGAHNLKISTCGKEKSYTFYKKGEYIRFGAEPDVVNISDYDDVSVILKGNKLEFTEQSPIIIDGRTLVPLRKIFEELDAVVVWDDDTQTVTAIKEDTTVVLSIGSNIMYVNEKVIELDVTARLINNKTLVPIRAISEVFGAKVNWDDSSKTVFIEY